MLDKIDTEMRKHINNAVDQLKSAAVFASGKKDKKFTLDMAENLTYFDELILKDRAEP